ncbi:MAG: hypothetical protein AAF198_07445 [Pseudomonadota bacterium]
MRSFFVFWLLFCASMVQAFTPSADQGGAFEAALVQFWGRFSESQFETIYDKSDNSFQAAVQKSEFLATWNRHLSDFGQARLLKVSDRIWYDQGASGIFAVSEVQFSTNQFFFGCGYFVFKETKGIGFRFIRSDILYVPEELRSERERALFEQVRKLPGCGTVLTAFD